MAKIRMQIEQARKSGDKRLEDKLQFELKRKQNILEYGESISDYTQRLASSKNILQQKTYIILSYYTSEFGDTSTYSNDEIDDIAFSELYTRAQTLIRALASAEVAGRVLNSEEIMELLYIAYNREQSEIYTLRNALNSEYDRLYSTAKDVLEEKKKRIEREIEEDAERLASNSIIKADIAIREKKERERKVKEKASKMVDEYKSEMSKVLYNETKTQIENADIEKETAEKPKRRVTRKNV